MSLAKMVTLAPRVRYYLANSSPIPELPPVTITCFPLYSKLGLVHLYTTYNVKYRSKHAEGATMAVKLTICLISIDNQYLVYIWILYPATTP